MTTFAPPILFSLRAPCCSLSPPLLATAAGATRADGKLHIGPGPLGIDEGPLVAH